MLSKFLSIAYSFEFHDNTLQVNPKEALFPLVNSLSFLNVLIDFYLRSELLTNTVNKTRSQEYLEFSIV